MNTPNRTNWITCLVLAAMLAITAGCGDDSPGGPVPTGVERLAGGGRAQDDDAFIGGRGDSGPVAPGNEGSGPGMPDFVGGLIPIFYSDRNCFDAPFERVITSQAELDAWWETAYACLDYLPPPPPGDPGDPNDPTDLPIEPGDPDHRDDATGEDDPGDPTDPPPDPVDTSWVEPDTGWADPGDPRDPMQPPVIDFEQYVVVAIGVEPENGWGRSVLVKEASVVDGQSVVRYEVSKAGEDCYDLLMGPFMPEDVETSPVVAVLVEKPFGATATFERTNTVWNCTWIPDPKEPITIYYTDTSCDLGPAEQIFTDHEAWEAWLAAATECDIARWSDGTRPGLPEGVEDDAVLPGEIDPTTGWMTIEVDFTTHAVIVLRAGAQTRWGGGIWLNRIDKDGGTTFDYSVMVPGDECPVIENGMAIQPTVAIRVPLPLASPIAFDRHDEAIDCKWEPMPLDGDVRDGVGGVDDATGGGSAGEGDGDTPDGDGPPNADGDILE
jgi:hypothetical protein